MKNTKRVLALVLAVLMATAALATFASCNKKEDTGVIKIGGTGPLTGDYAIYGMAAKQGAQIAVDEINKLGGLQFELRYEDDQGDPESAVNGYNILKDWGMQISLGGVTSGACAALATEAAADRMFALTPSASAPTVNEGKDNVFQMCFTDPNQGAASATYIKENNLGTKVAVIYQNDIDYSTGIYETFKKKADELGLEIVATQTFTKASQTDFNVQLTAAKNAGADLIFLPIYYTPASLILAQAKEMEYAPKFFGVDGMDGILTLEGFNKSLAEGVMLLTPFSADATDKKTADFVKTYKEKYGDVPNQFAADGYDAVYAIYEACKAANVTSAMSAEDTCAALIAQFKTMKFDGITGTGMTWAADGTVTKAPKAVVIENSVYVGMDK